MLSDEIASTVARFFDGGHGPSHDELTRAFARVHLSHADPRKADPFMGKMKRVRAVLAYAIDHEVDAGDQLVKILIGILRAAGAFRTGSDEYAGDDLIGAAREAFRHEGVELDLDGNLHQSTLENLEGVELTEALAAYVRRARRGGSDGALLVGTGKDLLEAVARHVLVEMTGSYAKSDNFPMTLHLAFDRLGLTTPPPNALDPLSGDPQKAVEEALWILGVCVNRLRSAQGTGHGRPFAPTVSDDQASIAIQAMGLVSELLLQKLPTPTKSN
jgi:hypothetical protein